MNREKTASFAFRFAPHILPSQLQMETRRHIAAERKRSGEYNCAQAVLCTYADKCGMTEEAARNVTHAFAAGMGNMEGTCGALVGAGIVLGLAKKERAAAMRSMRQVMQKFQDRNGATQCRALKGIGKGCPLRECPDCVSDASEFLEEELQP